MIYLACPYSDPDPAVREARFRAVNKYAAQLIAAGELVFSSISHSHPIALAGGLPSDWNYWEGFNRRMLSACSRVVVLCVPGWRDSIGVSAEVDLAARLTIPVKYSDP